MEYSLSITVLRTRFQLAIQHDDFTFNLDYDTEFRSIRSLIRYLPGVLIGSAETAQDFGKFESDYVNSTMGELMLYPISCNSAEKSVASLVLDRFCLEPIPVIAMASLRNLDLDICPNPEALFAELKVSSGIEWIAALASEAIAEKISVILFEDLLTALQHRTLYSFFIVPAHPSGFSSIGEACHSGEGKPLKSLVRSSKSGTVTMTLSRYNEDVGTDAVAAYEWHATLRSHKHNVDQAQACGMVYIFRRSKKGIALGDRSDLVLAADAIDDIDVLQVCGFLTQNVDTEHLLRNSDPCFVWLWERRNNAEKGLGAECLLGAVHLLQNRFKYVRTVVLSIKPLQFIEWEESNELTTVFLEKQIATESIMAYVQQLDLGRFNIRYVYASEVGNRQAAHFAIAKELQRDLEE